MDQELREHKYDFGYPIETNEMSRDFYLKNRVSSLERKNILDVFRIVQKSAIKNKLGFNYSIIGIGSSTYADSYYESLEKYFLDNGLGREDYILENAGSYESQFSDFETYEDYVGFTKKENSEDLMALQIPIYDKKDFLKIKDMEQREYSKKIKIGDILDKKGEDLDFMVGCDNSFGGLDYSRDILFKFKINFKNILDDSGYNFLIEKSHLSDSSYFTFGGSPAKYKSIDPSVSRSDDTFRIRFKEGRDLHFYFTERNTDEKIKKERIENYPFVQLVRRFNLQDLEDTIKNGEETGVFENPVFLK